MNSAKSAVNPREFARAAALILCLASCAAARDGRGAPAPQPNPSEVFQKAREVPAGAPKAFEFELPGFSYHLSANGNGRREGGGPVRRFKSYYGLAGAEAKLRAILSEFPFESVQAAEQQVDWAATPLVRLD